MKSTTLILKIKNSSQDLLNTLQADLSAAWFGKVTTPFLLEERCSVPQNLLILNQELSEEISVLMLEETFVTGLTQFNQLMTKLLYGSHLKKFIHGVTILLLGYMSDHNDFLKLRF